jgi:hypothetical protein
MSNKYPRSTGKQEADGLEVLKTQKVGGSRIRKIELL